MAIEPREEDAAPETSAEEENDRNLTTASLARATPADAASPTEARSFAGDKAAAETGSQTPLFPAQEAGALRQRWDEIQTGFVDEPRRAVEDADGLVAQAMKRLAETFAEERARLEGQWDRGDEVSTEDLRQALQRYRAFFGRLLAI